MANLQEAAVWELGVYQLEESDPVQAGAEGIDNKAPKQLANRTLWLKQQLELLEQSTEQEAEALQLQITNNKTASDNSISGLTTTVGNNKTQTDQAIIDLRAELRGVGMVAFFPGTSAPTGYLKANGATLARADYPELWAFAQNRLAPENDTFTYPGLFGSGDGVNTFKLPDVRGWFPRFYNDGASIDTEVRGIGSKQWDKVGKHEHSLSTVDSVTYSSTNKPRTGYLEENADNTPGWGVSSGGKTTMLSTSDTDSAWGETRVRNIALLGCIKY